MKTVKGRASKVRPARTAPALKTKEKVARMKAMSKSATLIRRVSEKLRADSYVSPSRRRIPFTV
jgi:hypothetical protein